MYEIVKIIFFYRVISLGWSSKIEIFSTICNTSIVQEIKMHRDLDSYFELVYDKYQIEMRFFN